MKISYFVINRVVAIILVCILLATLPVLACAKQAATSPPNMPSPEPAIPPAPAAPQSGIFEQSDSETMLTRGYDDSGMGTVDRKIVKSGSISLVVDNISDAMDAIAGFSRELGGYVVSSNKIKSKDDSLSGIITIRVPAEQFDNAFAQLRGLAVDILRENTNSVDVTEEYTDLQAQLHNFEATEAQYLSLMEKAETVEDILKVQQALSNVRGQIERIKGRIQYLDRTSDMSLIEISLQEKKSIEQNGWKASDTLLSAVRGLVTFLKVIANILIWVAIFCPIWIPIVIVVVRWRRKKAKAQRQKQQ